jgi:hypothetical protein
MRLRRIKQRKKRITRRGIILLPGSGTAAGKNNQNQQGPGQL